MKKTKMIRIGFYAAMLIILLLAISIRKQVVIEERQQEKITSYGIWQKQGRPIDVYQIERETFFDKVKLSCERGRERVWQAFVTKDMRDQLLVGQWARWNGFERAARVAEVGRSMDISNGLFKIELQEMKPLNAKRLVLIVDTVSSSGVYLVPNEALVKRDEQYFLWKLVAEQVALAPVKIGITNGVETIIKSGVKSGDQVVLHGKGMLKPNAKVHVVSLVSGKEKKND